MPKQNSQHHSNSDDVSNRLRLLRELESGRLDCLECPDCDKQTVSVWFSHPQETVYRTWFVCSNCSFRMRAQNTARPQFYSDERLSHELDVYDARLLKMTRLTEEEDS
jgi:transcription elongation factor Elf1